MRPSPRVALLEIDLQAWIVGLAHDDAVVGRARAARREWAGGGADVFSLRYLDAGGGERSDPASPAAAFAPGLEPVPGCIVLSKSTRNAFDNPDLVANLDLRGIDHVVVTGLLTDHGVRLAVATALDLGYTVTVLAGACAGSSAGAHRRALEEMAHLGARVRD